MQMIRADELQPGDVVKFTALPHVTCVYFYVRGVETKDGFTTIQHGIPEIGDRRNPIEFPCFHELTVVARGVVPDLTDAMQAKAASDGLYDEWRRLNKLYDEAGKNWEEASAKLNDAMESVWSSIVPKHTS